MVIEVAAIRLEVILRGVIGKSTAGLTISSTYLESLPVMFYVAPFTHAHAFSRVNFELEGAFRAVEKVAVKNRVGRPVVAFRLAFRSVGLVKGSVQGRFRGIAVSPGTDNTVPSVLSSHEAQCTLERADLGLHAFELLVDENDGSEDILE